ncbi:uncharacterized protein N7515_004650 [Penicillium bovifimosum]|uniref:Protein kinase domain-containing protein n=1 Tax=Penicillium bovifimosum TaxID=126998 RepID=A0A9W9H0I5_9EURO|nr:uncharacterized protein N7515_004650 [Penicillium bovifimosum]KAJ5135372.1 hypothetical protein N7515_004650 [Penicillium bovifimosum]
MDDPVRESIKEVDADTWLIGPLTLHRSKGYHSTSTWYDQDDDLSYTLTSAPIPLPPSVPLPAEHSNIRLVYDAGDSSAVWSVGKSAFCKVKLSVPGTTPEAATLKYVHGQRPYFEIPKVLHETEHNGRSYLFLSRVRGRTLANAWPTLNKEWRDHYMDAVVSVCKFLGSLESDMLSGVDGKNVLEPFLIKYGAKEDYSSHNLLQGCESMNMDCSKFVFYHADLGPGNIMVEETPETGVVGIIDWEVAGFFPKGWIRTKFRISSGLDLPDSVTDNPTEWRSGVQNLLGVHGFEDYSTEFVTWWFQKPE